MTFSEFLALLGQRKQTLFFYLALFLVLGAGLSLLQPFQYAAKAKLLVVQESKEGWVDPYQLQKSNEYVADVLAKVVDTNSFLVEVLNANTAINKNAFGTDTEKQSEAWSRAVKASASAGKGVVNLTVFQADRGQADQIMRGIIQVLKANHTQYHGLGEKIQVKVIDQPFVTLKPAKPDLPVNLAASAVFGLIFALTYIYLFPKSNISLWPFSGKKGEAYPQPAYFPQEARMNQTPYAGNQVPYQPPYQPAMHQPAPYQPVHHQAPAQAPASPAARLHHEAAYARPANLPFEESPSASSGLARASNGAPKLSAYNQLMDEGLSYEEVAKQGRMDNLR